MTNFKPGKVQKILITGGAGFIGSSLADQLVEKKFRVTVIDNFNTLYNPAIKKRNLSNLEKSKLFKLYEADITDKILLNALFKKEKPAVVVHIAGLTGMEASMKSPFDFFSNNVTGTLNVLESARLHGTGQVIYISTSTVYGNSKVAAKEDEILAEPLNSYAVSKLMAEQICRQYALINPLRIVVFRLCTVYGPRQRPNMAIAHFISRILKGEGVIIYGDGKASRDYLYIDDCVRAILLAMDHPARFDVFNIGGASGISINELIKTISALLDRSIQVKNVESPAWIPDHSSLNTDKARHVLGFSPETGFKEGIRQYINWYLKHQ
jgi:UDP-glucuronate 4-epimerase